MTSQLTNLEELSVFVDNNGAATSGLAAGVSLQVPENKKLVQSDRTLAQIVAAAVKTTMSWFQIDNESELNQRLNSSSSAQEVQLVFITSFIINNADISAEDNKYISQSVLTPAVEHATVQHIKTLFPQWQKTVWNLIISTKLAFVGTAHHIGQGSILPIVRRAIEAGGMIGPSQIDILQDSLHIIAHWSSLPKVLKWLGFPGLRQDVVVPPRLAAVDPPAEFTMRMSQAVAGTGRLYFCHAAAQRLLAHPLAAVYPHLRKIEKMSRDYKAVSENPLAYHVNKTVFHPILQSSTVKNVELQEPAGLGALVTFVNILLPSSTLAKSPICAIRAKGDASDLADFSISFRSQCIFYQQSLMNQTSELPQSLLPSFTNMADPSVIRKAEAALRGDVEEDNHDRLSEDSELSDSDDQLDDHNVKAVSSEAPAKRSKQSVETRSQSGNVKRRAQK